MNALDRFIPSPCLLEIDDIELPMPPERAWELVRHGDLGRTPAIRALFALRTLHAPEPLRIDDLVSTTEKPGFGMLAEEPGRTLVVGAIGKVWKRDIPFVHVPPAAYARFHDPGYVKVAWSITVEPRGEHGSRVGIELRVDATDGRAWRVFHRYFRVIGPWSRFIRRSLLASLAREATPAAAHDGARDVLEGALGAGVMVGAMLTPFRRRARSHWGLEESVALRDYPGDAIVASPTWSWTHGVEIDAPMELVWPWVAQIGADRGGFYSYQWLENLAGCKLHNADAVHPEWAHRSGDGLVLHPKAPPLAVDVSPGKWLLASTHSPDGKSRVDVSWLFFLEPLGLWRTRLVSRYRCATSDDLATRMKMGPTFVEPVGFAMDRRMLLGIKDRAELHARSASRAPDRPDRPRVARV